MLGLVRQLAVIHLRLGPEDKLTTTREGLDIGSYVPEFTAIDVVHKREVGLQDLKGRRSVLVFVSPSCGPCIQLMPHLAVFQRERGRKINVVVVSNSGADAASKLAATQKSTMTMLADPEGTIAQAYQARATPFAYHLDKEGRVQRRGIVNDLAGLEALLENASPSEPTVELPPTVTTPPTIS